ncbi:MAG: T9SS type A sorting domain-containing protein, partial [Chitinophagaceae bacterium]
PNPSNQYVQINIPSSSKGQATICVYDLAGKGLYKTKIEINEGLNQHSITEVGRWRPGIYMLSIDSEKGRQWHKIIVMHPKNGNYKNVSAFSIL